ncbi:hypothetical protein ACFRKD_06045 [Streptomyces niveus]|uniref:hypothetical protein n=1 Tax=Streptomyces niveus TaxID=193462 RepID=UPI00368637E4
MAGDDAAGDQDHVGRVPAGAFPGLGAGEAWLRRFMRGAAEGAAPASVVAGAIVAAATDPGTPVHTSVGDGAETAVDMAGKVSFDDWLPQFVQHAQTLAGLAPAPPTA